LAAATTTTDNSQGHYPKQATCANIVVVVDIVVASVSVSVVVAGLFGTARSIIVGQVRWSHCCPHLVVIPWQCHSIDRCPCPAGLPHAKSNNNNNSCDNSNIEC